MSADFFRNITRSVKLSDKDYVRIEKDRFVPISVTPFKPKEGEADGNHEGERPSEWLELAGDLAWTASFSSLTSNTTITGPMSVWNYTVFFALTWHLWATQTTYDIKYYTNDWWHRVLFASQLAIYAMLGALSGSFNVGWQLGEDTMYPSGRDQNDQEFRQYDWNSMVKSFTGVNLLLFASRIFLFAQYIRVTYYRWRRGSFSRGFLWPLASTLVAACIFLCCFFLVKWRDGSKGVAAAQIGLWILAISIQVLAQAKTPDDAHILKSTNTMPSRLATLTVIIMGEGLNRICSTLRHSVNSLGLRGTMVLEAISMLVILYCLWILYFDGFRTKDLPDKMHDTRWLWSHFPLHLSLILTLEGVKNLFLYAHVNRARDLLVEAFNEVVKNSTNLTQLPDHPRLESLLLPLKISWMKTISDTNSAVANIPDNTRNDAKKIELGQWFSSALYQMYLLFNEQPDPKAESLKEYQSQGPIAAAVNATVLQDVNQDQVGAKFMERYNQLMAYSIHWLLAVSGVLLVFMAIVNFLQRRPPNFFAWGYCLNRTAIGITLIVIGGATSKLMNNEMFLYWIIPTIAIAYCVAAIIDWIGLCISNYLIRRLELTKEQQEREEEERKRLATQQPSGQATAQPSGDAISLSSASDVKPAEKTGTSATAAQV